MALPSAAIKIIRDDNLIRISNTDAAVVEDRPCLLI